MGVVSKIVAALSRAQSEVERLELEVARWEADAQTKREELAELEASVGDVVLADETGTAARELAMTAMELRFTIDGAKAAARSAERKLRAARWALIDAQAAELREQAATVRAEAEQRQVTVNELKAALEEFEGGDWRPWQPEPGAFGTFPLSPLRTPPMFAEAERLDSQALQLAERVAQERRQAAVVVPDARIVWAGQHDHGHWTNLAVEAAVNDGAGTVRFEVLLNGRGVESFVLPDGDRRGVRMLIAGFHGDTLEVRADGAVLVSESPSVPDGEIRDGRGRPLILGHAS